MECSLRYKMRTISDTYLYACSLYTDAPSICVHVGYVLELLFSAETI